MKRFFLKQSVIFLTKLSLVLKNSDRFIHRCLMAHLIFKKPALEIICIKNICKGRTFLPNIRIFANCLFVFNLIDDKYCYDGKWDVSHPVFV